MLSTEVTHRRLVSPGQVRLTPGALPPTPPSPASRRFKSRSLPVFENGDAPQCDVTEGSQSKRKLMKAETLLHMRRRDQILQNFIRETEKKYGVSATDKTPAKETNTVKHSANIPSDLTHTKSDTHRKQTAGKLHFHSISPRPDTGGSSKLRRRLPETHSDAAKQKRFNSPVQNRTSVPVPPLDLRSDESSIDESRLAQGFKLSSRTTSAEKVVLTPRRVTKDKSKRIESVNTNYPSVKLKTILHEQSKNRKTCPDTGDTNINDVKTTTKSLDSANKASSTPGDVITEQGNVGQNANSNKISSCVGKLGVYIHNSPQVPNDNKKNVTLDNQVNFTLKSNVSCPPEPVTTGHYTAVINEFTDNKSNGLNIRRTHIKQQSIATRCDTSYSNESVKADQNSSVQLSATDKSNIRVTTGSSSQQQLVSTGIGYNKTPQINTQSSFPYKDTVPVVKVGGIDRNQLSTAVCQSSAKGQAKSITNNSPRGRISSEKSYSAKNLSQDTVTKGINSEVVHSDIISQRTSYSADRAYSDGPRLLKLRNTENKSSFSQPKQETISKKPAVVSEASKKLSERLKQGTKTVSHNKRFSSRSDESLLTQQIGGQRKEPVIVGKLTQKSISTRAVYLSSQSSENFANFGKNDFKDALKRLKDTGKSGSGPSKPVVVTNRQAATGSSLYNINEQVDSNDRLETPTYQTGAVERDTHARQAVKWTKASSSTQPYLASRSQEHLHTGNHLPRVSLDENKTTMQSMPSYTIPLKASPLHTSSQDVFIGENTRMNFDKPLTLQMRQNLHSLGTNHVTNSQQNFESNYKRSTERPKSGMGRRPVLQTADLDTVSQISESCSTGSGYSDNIADENYHNQFFAQGAFPSQNSNHNAKPRPKSSKGRRRHSNTENISENDTLIIQPGDSENDIEHENHQHSVSQENADTSSKPRPKSAKGRARVTKTRSSPTVTENRDTQQNSPYDNTSESKARPKSAKGRARITAEHDVIVDTTNNNDNNDNSNTETESQLHRPKSSKGRERDATRQTSHSGTQSVTTTAKTNTVKQDKTNISIDLVPFDTRKKVPINNKKQQRRHISSFMAVTQLDKQDPWRAQVSTERFCKPQVNVDIDSDDDTDLDGEIEILDLDDINSIDDLESSECQGDINTTADSMSSKCSSETSTAAWEQQLVHNYSSNNNNSFNTTSLRDKRKQSSHGNKCLSSDMTSGHDVCVPDTPRLTAKEMAAVKSRNHCLVNRSPLTYDQVGLDSVTDIGEASMQPYQKSSPVNGDTADHIDYILRGGLTQDVAQSTKTASIFRPENQSLSYMNKYPHKVEPQSLFYSGFDILATHSTTDMKLTTAVPVKPRKLQPIQQKKPFPADPSKTLLESASLSIFTSHNQLKPNTLTRQQDSLHAGIHTKPQKARTHKKRHAKRIDKMTIVHGEIPDSFSGSDSPGYITDGSLTFEYSNSAFRRMSDRS